MTKFHNLNQHNFSLPKFSFFWLKRVSKWQTKDIICLKLSTDYHFDQILVCKWLLSGFIMAMMETFFGTWNIGVFVIFVLVNNINFLIWKFQILHKNIKCTYVNIINLKFEPKIWKNSAYSVAGSGTGGHRGHEFPNSGEFTT